MDQAQWFCMVSNAANLKQAITLFFFFSNKMSDSDSASPAPVEIDRPIPNILVTGTPGTGKTTTSEMIANATGLEHVNVGEIVKAKQLHEGYLEEFDTHILDEDKVIQTQAHVLSI